LTLSPSEPAYGAHSAFHQHEDIYFESPDGVMLSFRVLRVSHPAVPLANLGTCSPFFLFFLFPLDYCLI
jgi:hypothetical protein